MENIVLLKIMQFLEMIYFLKISAKYWEKQNALSEGKKNICETHKPAVKVMHFLGV